MGIITLHDAGSCNRIELNSAGQVNRPATSPTGFADRHQQIAQERQHTTKMNDVVIRYLGFLPLLKVIQKCLSEWVYYYIYYLQLGHDEF